MEILILLFTIFYAILAWRKLAWATAFVIAFLPVYQIRFALFSLPLTLLEVMIFVLFVVWFVKSVKAKELPLLNYLSFPRKRESRNNIKSYPFWKEIIAVLVIAFISMLVAGASNTSLGILKAYFIEPIMFFIVFVNVLASDVILRSEERRPNNLLSSLIRFFTPSADAPVVQNDKTTHTLSLMFGALAFSAFIISAVAIYQKITGQLIPMEFANSGRVTGVFAYPNAVGLYLGPIVMLMVGWLLFIIENNKKQKTKNKQIINYKSQILRILFFCFFVFLPIIAIYFARSEGALIGIIVAGIIFGLLYNKWSRRTVIAILILGAVALSINSGIRQDVYQKVTLQDTDGQIRKQLWRETWQMLTDNPRNFIFGAGLANYQQAIAPYHESGIYIRNDDPEFDKMIKISLEYQQQVWQPLEIYLYPHNFLLNFWSELGLAGALLFMWVIVKFLILDFRLMITDKKNRAMAIGLLGAMMVIVVHGLVDAPYFKNDLAVLFWVLVAMMGIISPQINKSTTNNTNKK